MNDPYRRERTKLLAALDSGRALTAEEVERMNVIAAADAARPLDPWAQALADLTAESVAMLDRDLPHGITHRPGPGHTIEALSQGVVFATINADVVEQRAAEIRVERGL